MYPIYPIYPMYPMYPIYPIYIYIYIYIYRLKHPLHSDVHRTQIDSAKRAKISHHTSDPPGMCDSAIALFQAREPTSLLGPEAKSSSMVAVLTSHRIAQYRTRAIHTISTQPIRSPSVHGTGSQTAINARPAKRQKRSSSSHPRLTAAVEAIDRLRAARLESPYTPG